MKLKWIKCDAFYFTIQNQKIVVINQFCQIQSNHQVYSSKKLHDLYSTPAGWPGADDSFIQNRIDDLPKWIRGISSQALEDFSDILTEFRGNCIVLGLTGDIVSRANVFFFHREML